MKALVGSPELSNVMQCKTHQDNYSDKDSKETWWLQDFPSFGIVIYIFLPDMTHISTWTRYHKRQTF